MYVHKRPHCIMLIKPPIAKLINTAIIAPHGVTDLVHAMQMNTTRPLYLINLVTTGAFALAGHAGLSNISNFPFVYASLMHFRRDIPLENKYAQYCVIAFIVALGIQYNDLFYLYMVLRHVPRHYAENWKYMEKMPMFSIFLLVATTIVSMKMGTMIPMDDTYFDLIKGVIVSHILYEERYIYGDD